MEAQQNNEERVSEILDSLNWWLEQTYNSETGVIESTGEAQAAINNYLAMLDELSLKYSLEDGKCVLQNDD